MMSRGALGSAAPASMSVMGRLGSRGRKHFRQSSLRTQGPITPAGRDERSHLAQRLNDSPRRIGPCVRRDDPLRVSQSLMRLEAEAKQAFLQGSVLDQILHRALMHDLAAIHHCNSVAKLARDAKILLDQE